MKKLIAISLIVFVLMACNDKQQNKPIDASIFNGQWTYRSLLNDTDVNQNFNNLEFAEATIQLSSFSKDSLKGQILWAMDSPATVFNGLNLTGRYYLNDTTLCYFLEGFGTDSLGTSGWQYNYQGYLIPKWPEGIDQASVLTGSVVRVKKHSCDSSGNNCSPAGVVASTYMVKQK